jgi:hypothetical protein
MVEPLLRSVDILVTTPAKSSGPIEPLSEEDWRRHDLKFFGYHLTRALQDEGAQSAIINDIGNWRELGRELTLAAPPTLP